MTFHEIMTQLEAYGNEQTKRIFTKHGARQPFYGVKVGDLKTLVKRIKKNHQLSLELFDTGNSDAMYLAGLIADENEISKEQLQKWADGAYWYMLSEYTVPWIAAESRFGWELALEWIESERENIASSGWSTISNLLLIKPDNELNLNHLSILLDRVERKIHQSQNRVRYTMNGFVIAAGSSVLALKEKAEAVAEAIGKVSVDVGGTSCKVPLASEYIKKVELKGRTGYKKKVARC